MVFVMLAGLWFSGWVFAAIFFAITIFGLWEFYGLVAHDVFHPQKLFGLFAGIIIYGTSTMVYLMNWSVGQSNRILPGLIPFIILIPLVFMVFVLEIYRNKPNPLANIALTITGFLYIAWPLSLLIYLARPEVQHFLGFPVVLVGYFGFTWINDTAAYLYGKQFGRHKFFERISPKKTWEGTIAGAVVTYLLAIGLCSLVKDLPVADWLALATIVVFFGTHGDLVESLIKRSLNIKDSGTILPGHGGILDRFDTMFISAPFVFLYFYFQYSI